MMWKELRENAKWAGLGCFLLALAEFCTVVKGGEVWPPLLRPAFLLASSYGCALLGAALGVLQILPELSRDRWAGLLHRPVSRGVIFLGKALAGLLLYGAAAALPLLASALYVGWPGVFATPLTPGMLLPGLSDLLFGVVAYFAAVLGCLHRGRWWGSRGAVLLAMVPLFFLHESGVWPFLLSLLAGAVYAVAAWGEMQGEEWWLTRGAFVLVVSLGALMALIMVPIGLEIIFPQKWSEGAYTQFLVTADGQILISTHHGNQEGWTLTDLAGKAVTDERYLGNGSYGNVVQFYGQVVLLGSDQQGAGLLAVGFRYPGRYADAVLEGGDQKEIWYRLIQENYLIGYDRITKRCVGTLDARGFHPPGETPQPFAKALKFQYSGVGNPYYFWAGDKVYEINLEEHTVREFFDSKGREIYAVTKVAGRRDTPDYVAVALGNEVEIFNKEGKLTTIPYVPDQPLGYSLMIGANADLSRFYLQFSWLAWNTLERRPTLLEVAETKGGTPQSITLPEKKTAIPSTRWSEKIETACLPAGPVLLATAYLKYFVMHGAPVSTLAWQDMAAGSLLSALAAYLLARWGQMSGRQAARWTVFVLLFGVPGLVTFLIAAKWPVRVKCGTCEAKRPVREETCPHCAAKWPQAGTTGTEILEGIG